MWSFNWYWPAVLFSVHAGVALAVLALGLRGRRKWDLSSCRKCKGDLRRQAEGMPCPTCGADVWKPGAVRFLPGGLRFRLLVLGLAMVAALPLYRLRQPVIIRAMPGLRSVVPGAEPWEIVVKDVKAGRIGPAMAQKYFARAMSEVTPNSSRDYRRALAQECVVALARAGLLDPDHPLKYFKAAFGDGLEVLCRPVTRQNGRLLLCLAGADADRLPELASVSVRDGAGEPLKTLLRQPVTDVEWFGGSAPWGAKVIPVNHCLAPGEYGLQITCTISLAKRFSSAGIAGLPCEWDIIKKARVHVLPADTAPVEVVNDPELQRDIHSQVKIKACLVRPGIRQDMLVVLWEPRGRPLPAFVYQVQVTMDGRQYFLGVLRGGDISWESHVSFSTDVPENVRTFDVALIPDVERAAHSFDTWRLPKDPILFKDMSLRRYDLMRDLPASAVGASL